MVKIVSDAKTVVGHKTQVGIKIGPYWEFTRPHTIIGTTITVVTLFLITSGNISFITNNDYAILILTLMSSLLANIYIVGLNQIYDVEIDRINKPYLPLASGLLSFSHAKMIIILSAILSIIIAFLVNFWLVLVVLTGMGIGTFYSIPLTRYKSNPAIAAFSIAFVRGVLGNIGLYLSYKETLSFSTNIDSVIIFLTVFVLIFSFVIAIFKDIPDLEGDKKYHIMTFTVKMGKKAVFNASITILMLNYGLTILAGFIVNHVWNQVVIVILHVIILLTFYFRSQSVDIEDKISIWKFYKVIWYFFYLEYVVLIFAIILL